jgi:hypothetical protein
LFNRIIAVHKYARLGSFFEEALRIHKPKAEIKTETITPATVGGLIAACMRLSNARRESLEAYAKALRRIAAGVFEITDGKKFDAFKGVIVIVTVLKITPDELIATSERSSRANLPTLCGARLRE